MLKILQSAIEVPHEVLIVHDDDEDNSLPVIAEFQARNFSVRSVRNRLGRGVANAIRAGVSAAQGDYILIFAADEIGPVMAIDDMLQLMDHGCDLVSCTRYARGGRRLGGSMIGGFLSRVANSLLHRFGGMVLTDASTGIKMFRRSIFNKFVLEASPKGWAVDFELSMKAQLAGLRLGEVPIISIDRLFGGESTFRLWPWVQEYTKWFFWGFKKLRASGVTKDHVLTVDQLPLDEVLR
jgi:glycosyltransferase involved in cell wall biosynthesis